MKEIFIYGEIGWQVDPRDIARQFQDARGEEVLLRIHSEGGSVHDGNAIITAIRGHDAPVSGQVDGMAFSMGAVIALEVRERLSMPADAWIMFHEVRGGGGGQVDDLKRQVEMMESMNASIVSRLSAAMGKDEAEIAGMLSNEIWMTGEEAHAAGIVATITPAQALAAHARPDQFQNVPERLKSKVDNPQQFSKDSGNRVVLILTQ